MIDPKGDDGMREQLRRRGGARRTARSSSGPPTAIPSTTRSRSGSASEIADKALAGERFTEPHYLRQAQRYLGHAVRALQ